VTNTAGHCGTTFDATRTWQATDACGNSSSCSQTVNVIDTGSPMMDCSGTTNKTVQCGTAWTFDTPIATGNTVVTVLSTVTNPACGNTFSATRVWVGTNACGSSAQCSQTVMVVDVTAPMINCKANKAVELGSAWGFDEPTATDKCSATTISIVSTVTNAACGNTFSATRTWMAADACGNSAQCSQTVRVSDTTAPAVSLLSPTNGAVFVAPAEFTILADARDTNGIISRVEFYSSTNKIAAVTNGAPYFVLVTNLAAGSYTFTAIATDGCGNAATSAPVTITVLAQPPLTIIAAMHFNPQTGLFEQTVRVNNPTYTSFDAVRVYVYGLTGGATVYNPSGTDNGVQYIQSFGPIASGSYVDFTIEYYVPSRVAPNPTLVPQLVPPSTRASAVGVGQHINRGAMLPDKTFLIEFASISNRLYAIQYSKDLVNWETAQPALTGNGTYVQWIDNGQPKTESSPAITPVRFYRLLLLP
jgi:hypothetical protein